MDLPEVTSFCWHGYLAGLQPGQQIVAVVTQRQFGGGAGKRRVRHGHPRSYNAASAGFHRLGFDQ